jgi:hypothetical protein
MGSLGVLIGLVAPPGAVGGAATDPGAVPTVTSAAAPTTISDRVLIMLTEGPNPQHQTSYTTTDLWKINLAISLANRSLAAGRPTTLFLDVHAPALARRTLSPTLHFRTEPPIKTQLANFISDGGVVLICPLCAATMGVKQSQVIPGVTFNDAGIFGPEGLAPGAVSLSF